MAQIATANLGQMTQLHTATSTRNADHRRDNITAASVDAPPAEGGEGQPEHGPRDEYGQWAGRRGAVG